MEKAKQQMGVEGEENPKFQSAHAVLRKAKLDLTRTKIHAPSQGGITNLQVDVGHYASPGTPLMTFISVDDVWIQANFRENSVANIKPGDSAGRLSLQVQQPNTPVLHSSRCWCFSMAVWVTMRVLHRTSLCA